MGDVVLRLKADCVDYFSPIGAYVRVIGSNIGDPRSFLFRFKEFVTQFKLSGQYEIQPLLPQPKTNYRSLLES